MGEGEAHVSSLGSVCMVFSDLIHENSHRPFYTVSRSSEHAVELVLILEADRKRVKARMILMAYAKAEQLVIIPTGVQHDKCISLQRS